MVIAEQLLKLSNATRARAALRALALNPQLTSIAQAHALAMALGGYFDHVDNEGRGVGERLMQSGYIYRWCGENISAGKDNSEDVMQWWLSSPPHRDNILKPEFTETGFGYYYIEHDRNSFHHYWVQVFATPFAT